METGSDRMLRANAMTLERSRSPSEPGSEETNDGSQSAHLCLVFQFDHPLCAPVRFTLAGTREVFIGRHESGEVSDPGSLLRIRVGDSWMSNIHAHLSKEGNHWILKDCDSRNGTFVNRSRVQTAALEDGDLVELGQTFFIFRSGATSSPADLASDLDSAPGRQIPALRTLCAPLELQFRGLAEVIKSNIPVVIEGQTGTGKELIAQAIHRVSGRTGAFVGVNCGALAPTLIHSELFGYKRGAFSGALADHLGLLRSADGGTLFLDEVADLPLELQGILLRVLQEALVLPVGSTKPVPVDLRVCSATHRSLEEMVSGGNFRGDLLARLSGFTLRLPPLCRRLEDLGLLIGELLYRYLSREEAEKITFSRSAAHLLFRHAWPYNIRELEKHIRLAVVLATDRRIRTRHLPELVSLASSEPGDPIAAVHQWTALGSAEQRDLLVALLKRHDGNVAAVARALRKRVTSIRRWLKRYRLDPTAFRS